MASPEISAPRPSRVSAARRLAKRAFRERDRRFLAEGPQAVREALVNARAGVSAVRDVFLTAEAAQRNPGFEDVPAGVTVYRVEERVLGEIAQTVTPQGVVAVCDFLDVPLEHQFQSVVGGRPRLIALLAHVRDPGNAGTVIRCADAAGADGVILSSGSVDVYNPKAVRSSAGSVFHLPITVDVELPDTIAALKRAGLTVLAADGGVPGAIDLDRAGDDGLLTGPIAWLFGNEAWGLPREIRDLADHVVSVPIHGRAESLNLGTAAAVCLYATASAQRRAAR
ncbi:MAG TPA: RNA methyltransferase [Actinopolymorphaceae bacterium]|jgi:TrmH family RNA methyltransferase